VELRLGELPRHQFSSWALRSLSPQPMTSLSNMELSFNLTANSMTHFKGFLLFLGPGNRCRRGALRTPDGLKFEGRKGSRGFINYISLFFR
jgi:hypothetical protein